MELRHSVRKLTYADYVRFPDDNLRHEIIGGRHYVSPSPATVHQRILGELFYVLSSYSRTHPIGEAFIAPFDVLLSEVDVVVPDIIYRSNECRARYLTEKNLQGPPDLVVEILSPSTHRRDRGIKRALYSRVGVNEYWMIDPKSEAIEVYRRTRQGSAAFAPPVGITAAQAEALWTPLLPGFELPLTTLFGPAR